MQAPDDFDKRKKCPHCNQLFPPLMGDLLPRQAGRPKREPKPGERVGLSLRVTPEMKARLEAAREATGRSLSQEAEFRLEISLDREDLLAEVLRLAFGKRTAGLLLMLGYAMTTAAHFQNREHPSPLEHIQGSHWTDDPNTFEAATGAAIYLIHAARPDGEIENSGYLEAMRTSRILREAICEHPTHEHLEELQVVRSFLGPIVDRLREETEKTNEVIEELRNEQVRRAQGGKP